MFRDAFAGLPWDPLSFCRYRHEHCRHVHYGASAAELKRSIDAKLPALVASININPVFKVAPPCCKNVLAMALCQRGTSGRHQADTDRFRMPAFLTQAAADGQPVQGGSAHARAELNQQMRNVVVGLRSDGFFYTATEHEITKSLARNFGETAPLVQNWKTLIHTSICLADKPDKPIAVGNGGEQQLPARSVIWDARLLNARTAEPARVQAFSLMSLLQEVSNVTHRCAAAAAAGAPLEWYTEMVELHTIMAQIPLPPQLAALFPLKLGDTYVLPRSLPAGWKCSPLIAHTLTWALVAAYVDGGPPSWFGGNTEALKNGAQTPRFLHLRNEQKQVVGAVFVLLDSVFFIGNDKATVQAAVAHLRKTCRECGAWIKGEGQDHPQKVVTPDDKIQTIQKGSTRTIEFCGIEFGFDGWCMSDQAFGASATAIAGLTDTPTYRQAAALLGCSLWNKLVRGEDMLSEGNVMQLFRKVLAGENTARDAKIESLTEDEHRLLVQESTAARSRQRRQALPMWDAPQKPSETGRYQIWGCEAACRADHFCRAATYLGANALGNGKVSDAKMFCEVGSRCVKQTLGFDIMVERLEAVRLAVEKASTSPGWAGVALFIVVGGNTTVETWLARGYTDFRRAVPTLRRIRELLGESRRLVTINVPSDAQLSSVGTRDLPLNLDADGKPEGGWESVAEADARFTATVNEVRRSFSSSVALALLHGLPGRIRRREEVADDGNENDE